MHDEFAQIVSRHIADADRPSDVQGELFDRYMGEPLGDEQEGLSKAQTSEVFDTIEALSAEIMDLMISDTEIVSFKPMNEGDEDNAKSETDACNHIFWERNNGFEVMQTWLKSGLIEQMGYCRSGWVRSEQVTIEEYTDLPLGDALAIQARYEADPDITDVEVIDMEGATKDEALGYVPEFGEDNMPLPVSFKVRCVKQTDEYEIEPVPQSRVLITGRWHRASLQTIPFVAIEHDEYTRSDLIAMGFHPDDVAELSDSYGDEHQEDRHDTKDNQDDERSNVDNAVEQVRVYECWVLHDRNEDGVAERLKVWMGHTGGKIMRWSDGSQAVEEVDSVDMSAWTPIAVPHRHRGRSAAEIVDDLQSINTVLLRQTLDSTYKTLYPRPVVDALGADAKTMSDLANVAPGAPIRVRNPNAVTWSQAPNISGVTIPMMEKINALREERTGVTRLNQGLDASTLNDTAQGQQMLLTQGQKRIKLMARNFAEGVRDLFLRMHRDLRRGNIRKLEFKVRGKWMEQDPLTWPARKAMSISVGTGNGDKVEKRQTLNAIAQIQREMIAAGSSMVGDQQIYDTFDRLVKLGGYSSGSQFILDPRSPEFQQAEANKPAPPPDPNLVLAEAEATKARAQAEKATAEGQYKMAQIALEAQESRQAHELRMAELQLEETKVAAKIQVESEKQDLAELAQAEDEAFRRDKLAKEIILDVERTS